MPQDLRPHAPGTSTNLTIAGRLVDNHLNQLLQFRFKLLICNQKSPKFGAFLAKVDTSAKALQIL